MQNVVSRFRRWVHVFAVSGLSLTAVNGWATPVRDAQELRFNVFLDERPIGEHRFEIRESGSTWRVTSVADFSVDFLFFNVYRYRHQSRETWRDGCLEAIEATTDDNGERLLVRGTEGDGSFAVIGPAGRFQAEGCLKTFAYWDPSFLEQPRLLNPQTGELVNVAVSDLGRDRIDVGDRPLTANKYQLEAEGLDIELWYHETRGWVGLESDVGEGRRLIYRLQ